MDVMGKEVASVRKAMKVLLTFLYDHLNGKIKRKKNLAH
jgi:hypothetical protein